MPSKWEDYEEAAERGPWSLFWKVLFPITAMVVIVIVVIGVIGYAFGWIGEGAKVAQEEFGPAAARDKYEWFIRQQSFIEKSNNDITTYEQRVTQVRTNYVSTYGENKTVWPLAIQIQYQDEFQTAYDDLVAVVSTRNNLVKDYNAASRNFFWEPFKDEPDRPPQLYEEYVVPANLKP